MRAGKLDRRITIQVLAVARDGVGQEQETWNALVTRWSAVTAVSGGESFGDQQRVAKSTKTFEIRYLAGLSPKEHRILFDGETYDIESIDEIGRRQGQLITAHAFEPETGP